MCARVGPTMFVSLNKEVLVPAANGGPLYKVNYSIGR